MADHEWIRCRILGKGSFGKVYAIQHSKDATVFRVIKEMSKYQILNKGDVVVNMMLSERVLLTGNLFFLFQIPNFCQGLLGARLLSVVGLQLKMKKICT